MLCSVDLHDGSNIVGSETFGMFVPRSARRSKTVVVWGVLAGWLLSRKMVSGDEHHQNYSADPF